MMNLEQATEEIRRLRAACELARMRMCQLHRHSNFGTDAWNRGYAGGVTAATTAFDDAMRAAALTLAVSGEPENRVQCDGCNADYSARHRGGTCIECDGTIGGEPPQASEHHEIIREPRVKSCNVCGVTLQQQPLFPVFACDTHRTRSEPHPDTVLPQDIREALLRIGEVQWGATAPHNVDGHLNHLRITLDITAQDHGQTEPVEMHGVYLKGTETVLCHTGTSPNSPQHARIITGAWNQMVRLAMKSTESTQEGEK